ncbi:hypothetical protein Enr13x_08650 [Stieleria neptunia]|uniref:Cytochrome c domain-containing protein n=1 Tax=Stieleria neptunia TaxID=2527979 RepID=A0A518HJJ7_9BACT|nr:DUF2339 domain-containing protein [Stieleria neptunia]QDV41027.1 hypothetical protein Enr13x_08650 [Stieleria neptunia]
MKSPFAFASTALIVLCLCTACTPVKQTQTDDAKKRATAENVSNDSAAAYFTYRDPDPYDNDDSPHVPDFFAGMDAISRPAMKTEDTAEKDPRPSEFPDPLLDRSRDDNGSLVRAEVTVEPADLNLNERIGRNTWMAWCAGNEGFWDWLCTDSLGFIDLLKLVDSRRRAQRFAETGMINEPGMEQARSAREEEFGLWLDSPTDDRVRRWRQAYVRQTFAAIAAGKHKSQVGLQRRAPSGGYDGPPLYTGAPDAFKNEGYRYPSSYLTNQDASYGSGNQTGYAGDAPYRAGGDGQSESSEPSQRSIDDIIPPPDLYGLSSGVIGLRLFPNPYFDAAAQARWQAERFYNDDSFYNDPTLVRPYRVGMSCAFCHASFHPLEPPRDVNNPRWTNLSGNIGAQYLSMRATVGGQLTPDQFVYHLLESQPRGTIDTSLIASDNINNPNTMNAVFGLPQRAILSFYNPQERLSNESSRLPSLWKHPNPDRPGDGEDVVPPEWVQRAEELDLVDQVVHSNDNPRHVPRILLDGSDSIGTWGALARVYLNIGSYWEQWNQLHQVVIGLDDQKPFRLADCEEYSVYWNATEQRVPGLRDYFLKITPTMPLLSTAGGEARMEPISDEQEARWKRQSEREKRDVESLSAAERAKRIDVRQLARGRKAFARNCIVCHSSIQPESTAAIVKAFPTNADFDALVAKRLAVRNASQINGEFWEHDPAQWLDDPSYQAWAEAIVEEPTFWTENYLSTDYRIPVNLVKTNASRAMGTNGMTGHMWEDFASESYRELPSPGEIEFFNPYEGDEGTMQSFSPRHINPGTGKRDGGGGPGYYRVPSLMSIWATAPLLHNNSLGLYNNDPSVDGRLAAFDDAIRKLLWPEKRLQSSSYNDATPERLRRDHGLIWRTTEKSYLRVDAKRVPGFVYRLPFVKTLHQSPRLMWLRSVHPLWLPGAIFLGGALIILLVSRIESKRLVAYLIVAIAIVLAAVLWWARSYSGVQWAAPLRNVYPWLLPVLTLVAVALVLWLPLSRRVARWCGYGLVIAALVVSGLVYFKAGRLGDVNIGPIPKGTPVNLLANFNPEAELATQKDSVATLIAGLAEIESRHLKPDAADRVMKDKIAPALMAVNKCPDFVMDKGHYFPWFDSMTDEDKNALIELLKTL